MHIRFSRFSHNTKWRVRNFQTDCETETACACAAAAATGCASCCCCWQRRRRDIATHNGNFARLALLLLWVVPKESSATAATDCDSGSGSATASSEKRAAAAATQKKICQFSLGQRIAAFCSFCKWARERTRASKQVCFVVCVYALSLCLSLTVLLGSRFLSSFCASPSTAVNAGCLGMQL